MKPSDDMIEQITRSAVEAALGEIDKATCGTSNKHEGACGDELAYKLHSIIEKALTDHYSK